MKTMNIFFITLAVILIVSVLSAWFVPSLQDFMTSNTIWNGIRDFTSETGAESIDLSSELSDSPPDSTVLVIPYLEFSDEELAYLKYYVEQGGTILLMDDYGFGNQVLEYLGVSARFSGAPLLDPLFCYKKPALPRITDFAPAFVPAETKDVVLNHATALLNINNADVIAWSSPTSFLDNDDNGVWNTNEPQGHLPIAARISLGKGIIVLASDPSLVINSMVNKDDNYSFVKELLSLGVEQSELLMDTSHLTDTPLDVTKSSLTEIRSMMAAPYPSLAILLIAFIIASRFILKTGG